MSIDKLKNGCGVAASLIIDGQVETFRLAVVAEPDHFAKDDDRWTRLRYAFINVKQTLFISGMYSGGVTGFGEHNPQLMDETWHERYRLITTNLDEINFLAEWEDEVNRKIENDVRERQMQIVDEINKLPSTFTVGIPSIDEVVEFRRSEAHIDATRNRIYGGIVNLYRVGENQRDLYIENYVSKSGQMLVSKFTDGDMKWTFGKVDLTPRTVLEIILKRKKEVEKMVNDIKYR
jgi:hypothetical protein